MTLCETLTAVMVSFTEKLYWSPLVLKPVLFLDPRTRNSSLALYTQRILLKQLVFLPHLRIKVSRDADPGCRFK